MLAQNNSNHIVVHKCKLRHLIWLAEVNTQFDAFLDPFVLVKGSLCIVS